MEKQLTRVNCVCVCSVHFHISIAGSLSLSLTIWICVRCACASDACLCGLFHCLYAMTTVTTTMIVMPDFINSQCMRWVQRWSIRTRKLSSLFSCWNFHRFYVWRIPISHGHLSCLTIAEMKCISFHFSLFQSHSLSVCSSSTNCILHTFCSTNADIYQFSQNATANVIFTSTQHIAVHHKTCAFIVRAPQCNRQRFCFVDTTENKRNGKKKQQQTNEKKTPITTLHSATK